MSITKQILRKHCPSMDEIFLDDERRAFRKRILDAMEEYADICAKETLLKANDNLVLNRESLLNDEDETKARESILNVSNVVLL